MRLISSDGQPRTMCRTSVHLRLRLLQELSIYASIRRSLICRRLSDPFLWESNRKMLVSLQVAEFRNAIIFGNRKIDPVDTYAPGELFRNSVITILVCSLQMCRIDSLVTRNGWPRLDSFGDSFGFICQTNAKSIIIRFICECVSL